MASSMPSSAQWMSSNAITSGRLLAILSIPMRSAEKNDSRRRSGSRSVGHQLRRHLDAEQPADQRGLALAGLVEPLVAVAEQVGHVARELPPRLLGGVRVHDPALGAQHLAERPEHDAGAVGEAAAGAHGRSDGVLAEHALELAQQARLAHARLADQAHQVRGALSHHALVEGLERHQLVVAPHERRLVGGRAGRTLCVAVRLSASQAGTGSALPFRSSGWSSS